MTQTQEFGLKHASVPASVQMFASVLQPRSVFKSSVKLDTTEPSAALDI